MRPGWRLPSMAWGRGARLAATLGGSADIGKVSAVFSVSDRPGALQTALQFFWKNDVNMTRIESRPSKFTNDYDVGSGSGVPRRFAACRALSAPTICTVLCRL